MRSLAPESHHVTAANLLSNPLCQVGEEVLGVAAKVEISKESTTIVGDGSTEDAVKARVKQIKNIVAETEMDYEKEKLNERIARLSGGVAIIQVPPVEIFYWKTMKFSFHHQHVLE